MLNRIFFIVFFSIFICSCMATGKGFQSLENAESNKSVIYIFRKSDLFNFGGAYPDYSLDGSGKYPLKNNGYWRFIVEPGVHKFDIVEEYQFSTGLTWPHRSIEIKTEPGQTYFVQYHIFAETNSGSHTLLQTYFKQLSEIDAMKILPQTKLMK